MDTYAIIHKIMHIDPVVSPAQASNHKKRTHIIKYKYVCKL